MSDAGAGERLPLPALLSAAWVAFVIEFDNEFEQRMPHRTTRYGATPGHDDAPWLVSMAMWMHCMRHVPPDGITAAVLARRAQLSARGARTILTRMGRRWGYLRVRPDTGAGAAEPPPEASWIVRPTPAGSRAQEVWGPLGELVTDRWRSRLGEQEVDGLLAALDRLVAALDRALPVFLPIGDVARSWRLDPRAARLRSGNGRTDASLITLLSQPLLAFALDFELHSDLSLALSANVLRVLDDGGVPVRDLPALTGIAEMGVANSLSALDRHGYVTIGPEPGSRLRVARPTARGVKARDRYHAQTATIEREWAARYGAQTVGAVRDALARLVGGGTAADSPLFAGLRPYPDGWRAQVRRLQTLPHFPIVAHRGGFPDGS